MKLVWIRPVKYTEPPTSSAKILDFISQTHTGRALAAKLEPHLKSQRVQIATYPEEIRKKLAATRTADQPAGACFIHDGETGTIYYDSNSDLATVSVFLVHEITHALDENLWNASREDNNSTSSTSLARAQFESECQAFRAQHEYLAELGRTNPEVITFLQNKYPAAKILHELMDENKIIAHYGFPEKFAA